MKKITLLFVLLFGTFASAQCPDDNISFGQLTNPINDGVSHLAANAMTAGEYLSVNVIAGNLYFFDTCGSSGYDPFMTIYGNTGNVIGFNDDYCGLNSGVSFVASVTETVRVLVDVLGTCSANSVATTLNYTATVLCTDPTVPVLTATPSSVCPGSPVTLSLTGTLNDATSWQWYSGSCGGTSVGSGTSITVSPTADITYFARGEGGCVSPGACGSVSVTASDTTAPTWTVAPSNSSVECDGTADPSGAFAAWLVSFSGTDNCGTANVTNNSTGLSNLCGATGAETVTFTLDDGNGNSITQAATFTIVDTVAPTIDVAASDLTVECDGFGNGTELTNWLSSIGTTGAASDICGGVTWTNDFTALSNGCGNTGTALVTFMATDDCGNFSTTQATFTIEDTTAPTIDVAASDLTVECDGAGNVTELTNWLSSIGTTGVASDICGGVTWTNDFTALSNDCGNTGAALVTFTATDDCGNFSTTQATFTIVDTVAPTIDVAASDLTVECDGFGNGTELTNWLSSIGTTGAASDICGGVTWTNDFTALSNGCGNTGTALVTFMATDDCGNFSTTQATFTIEDTTAPTIDVAASDLTVECDGAGNVTELTNWLSSIGTTGAASDTCAGVTWTNDFTTLSNDCGNTGAALVTFMATDECGNFSTTQATFTIVDTTVPTIDVAASDLTVECDGFGNGTELTNWLSSIGTTGAASDICGGVTWTNDFTTLSNDCGNTGAAFVTFTATDDCGNFSTTQATFTIEDTTAPTIDAAASDLTVECDGAGNTTDLTNWLSSIGTTGAASDICAGITWTNDFTALSNDCGNTGAALVTFTATDDCGNFSTTQATFTIVDTVAPTIDAVASDLTVECDGAGNTTDLTNWLSSIGTTGAASDICAGVTWTNDFTVLSNDCGNTGTALVTFTATDDCGNFSTTQATFTIEDTTAPTIDVAASDLTVECDGAGNTTALNNWLGSIGTTGAASDLCSEGAIPWYSLTSGTETDYIQDEDDDSEEHNLGFDFTFFGNTFNSVYISSNGTLSFNNSNDYCCSGSPLDDGSYENVIAFMNTDLDPSDQSDDIITYQTVGVAPNREFVVSYYQVPNYDDTNLRHDGQVVLYESTGVIDIYYGGHNWTLSDAMTIGISNATGTVGVGLAGWVEFNNSVNPTHFQFTPNGASYNVTTGITWTNDFTALSDDCGATGSALVTFTATDECGNFSTTQATFTIEDTTAPTIDVAASDLTVECDGSGNTTALNNWLSSIGTTGAASDICGGVTWTNDFTALSDDCGNTGTALVTFTATDECGNFSTTQATFTIEDTTAPTIDVAASDLTVECDGAGNVTELTNWLSSIGTTGAASDICAGVTWTNDFTALSNGCGNTGTALVTFTATDDCGNFSTTQATFTIEDTTAPTIDVAASDLTVECDGAGNVTDLTNWLSSIGTTGAASDICGGVTWTNDFTALSDDCGATGSALVTFTATDDCGNFSTTQATFTIEDTTAPTIDVAASDLTVECDGAGNVTELTNWLSSIGTTGAASDICGGVTWTNDFTALSDDCGATGSALVTFTATDDCGNFSTTQATFTIVDTTAPTIDVAASDLTVECDGAGNTTALNDWLSSIGTTGAASDICGGVTWTNDFTALSNDCGATGSALVTFTATDDCGNFSTTQATFTIEDTTPALIACPGDVTAIADPGSCGAIVVFQPAVALEECGWVIVAQTGGLGSGSVFPVGDTLVEFTATDECFNTSTCTFTITVEDTEAPVVNCNDLTIQLDEFGTASITAEDVDGVSTDNCGIATLSIDVDTFDCSNVGANTVVLTVTDVHGNAATCSATVTVEDITPPEVFCQDLTVALDANGTAVITGMDMDAGSTDACGIGSYELSMDTFDCNYIGNNTVTLYVTDVNGNMSSCTATVTVEDNIAPTLVCTDVTIELGPDGITYISPSDLATVEDPCGVVVFEADLTQVSCADIGAPITVSVFAIDSNGNPSFCSSVVTVVDLLGPAIVCPPNEVVIVEPNGTYTLGDYIADGIATVTDNCSDPVTIFTQSPAAGTLLGYGIHDITFTAEDEYGNVATCSFELNIQELLGTTDNELGSLVLYPNPANNQVYLSNPSQLELNEVIIYDLTGRMVNRVDLSNMGLEKTIDISGLANATYMVIINGAQGTTAKQLIVGN